MTVPVEWPAWSRGELAAAGFLAVLSAAWAGRAERAQAAKIATESSEMDLRISLQKGSSGPSTGEGLDELHSRKHFRIHA